MESSTYVAVPVLQGLNVAMAHHRANAARLAVVGPMPDLPSPRHARVRGQYPAPGTRVLPGDPISVWIEHSVSDDHSVPGGDGAQVDGPARGSRDPG